MKFTSVLKKLLLLTVILSNNCLAKQYTIDDDQNIQYFGYVGYKYLYNDVNLHHTFHEDGDPELGLNVIYNNKNFQIFNQFRYGEESETALVYNFMQYSFNLFDDVDFIVKGGKLRHDFGLYNTSRINPTTRQGVLMPQSIYWDAFEEFMTSGVGVGATLKTQEFELSYSIDDPTVIDPEKINRTFYGGLMNNVNTSFGSHQIASITYSPLSLPLITKASWVKLNGGDDTGSKIAAIFPRFANRDIIGELITFGAEYKWKDFVFSGETLWFSALDKPWNHISDLSRGYSLTTTYQANEHIDLRVNYNEYESSFTKLVKSNKEWLGYYKDLNVGVNYHVDNWMFQIEGHYIRGSRALDPLDVWHNDADDFKNWYMIGTNIVYSF